MANNDAVTSWKTTVIVSSSLQTNELSRLLSAQQHRLRFSDSVEADSLVLPLSGTAFMLITPEQVPEKPESSEFFKKVEKFIQVHRNSFLLLQSPVFGSKEWECVSTLQTRFFGSNVKIVPVHSSGDAARCMLTIAKATSKPHVDGVRDRMNLARARIVTCSPVWDVLRNVQFR